MAQVAQTAFDAWFAEMARWEGGQSDEEHDRGGLTNRGITYTTFQALAAKLGIPNTRQRFDNLTVADHRKFARYYWDGVRGDDYDQGIAILLADMWWGGGTGQIKYAQRAINRATGSRLVVDGVAGPRTAAAINAAPNAANLFEAIAAARRQFIRDFIASDPTQNKFRVGWERRMAGIEGVGRQWIGKKKAGPRG